MIELDQLQRDLIIADVGRFGASGYVVESVPLALYTASAMERYSFEALLQNVIEAGGDTDTIASMTGQVAGAWLGALPNLSESLPHVREIERVVNEFAATV